LYFSCKNCQELAQARITKVVGYFTTKPTKLVLHFSDVSMIFYAIYKNQQTHFTILVHFCREALGKKLFFAMSPLGRSAGAGRPKSGEPLVGARRARAGVNLQTPMAPFRGSLGVEAPSACMLSAAPRRWPLDLVSRRTGDQCKLACDLGAVGRFKGRWDQAWFGGAAGRDRSSPRLPAMAPQAARSWPGRHVGGQSL
jgi:hypothetical protein